MWSYAYWFIRRGDVLKHWGADQELTGEIMGPESRDPTLKGFLRQGLSKVRNLLRDLQHASHGQHSGAKGTPSPSGGAAHRRTVRIRGRTPLC